MSRRWMLLFSQFCLLQSTALSQSADFLRPQQKGPFQVNGLAYVEFPVTGPQSGFVDPVNIGYPVPTTDQIISEIQATGANLVRLTITVGMVKNYEDNAYDAAVLSPFEAGTNDVLAFGRKLTSRGISCAVGPFTSVEGLIVAGPGNSRIEPVDRRAFMRQHIPRIVSLAQVAQSMGCEYFLMFMDDLQHLAADPNLTDLWIQAINQVRAVFSGRITALDSWNGTAQPCLTFCFPYQMMSLLDIFGLGFYPPYTDHPDPTVAELVASFQKNVQGNDILQLVRDLHTFYGKPLLVTDFAKGSYKGSNMDSGGVALYGGYPISHFTLDYGEQANQFQAFLQAMPSLDPTWMLGAAGIGSFDRLPYEWKDVHLFLGVSSVGESIRGKPATQVLTQAFQTGRPITAPVNGWWYSPATRGVFYTLEAENGVVRLGSLTFSPQGSPQWTLQRCMQTAPGTYAGTQEMYTGGWALNQTPRPPASIVDGPGVEIIFRSATTATLRIGTQSVLIQRYQFSDNWASPMLNAPRAGWWDQTSQSGRAYFLEIQGNSLLLGGLIYDASGAPSWFTSAGLVDSAGTFAGNLTVCSAQPKPDGSLQTPDCKATGDTIRLAFSSPWSATLRLAQEPPIEIRRYRQAEIGWAGPAPSFPSADPGLFAHSATVNAASFIQGVAPGSIGTIFGTGLTRGVTGIVQASTVPLPWSLRGTSVLVNGIPAPIFAIANINGQEQINFQVPWEVQGKVIPNDTVAPSVTVTVVNNGQVSPAMRTVFEDIQPAVITLDGSHAVAVHSDYSLVTRQNPAHPGEVITVYGIGFGPVAPAAATGVPAGSSPPSTLLAGVRITLNGHDTSAPFAGISPGSVGLYQFNVVVPDRVGAGELNLLINVAGRNSNLTIVPVQ